MYSPFQLALKYLRYYVTASNSKGHGMHSPFVYRFIRELLLDRKDYPEYRIVEQLRRKLKADKRMLQVADFGAGSRAGGPDTRSVGSIAAHAAKPAKYGQLLFRMARRYRPQVILEMGTSLGLTTAYLSLADPRARVYSLEGAPAVAAIARENFAGVGLENISLVEGNFDDTLAPVLDQLEKVDLGFIDGNHREEPTTRYYRQILAHTHNDSILVFDDIHWSPEMEAAWEAIRNDPAVRCSIDLFFVGIVLFRKEFREKQHFSIRF